MRTVHKFTVPHIGSVFVVAAGATFKPVALGSQWAEQQVWAEVETSEEPNVRHQLAVVGTGHPIPHGLEWIATTQDGPFVWHLYGVRA